MNTTKVIKLFILFMVLLNLTGCNIYNFDKNNNTNKIIIEKINIDEQYDILSKDDSIKQIAMFEEFGRPNIEDSNVVMGAHSGTSKYAKFNDINALKPNDKIFVYYNDIKYVYTVKEIKEVNETQMDILDDKGLSILTLLTCKINDSSKRIVVISTLDK